MSHKFKCSFGFIIAGLSLSGCAGEDRILFVTKTNLGLDLDSKPPTAEITIARRELAITPAFQNSYENENTLPLLASFGLTGTFLNPEITSRFAGGDAAVILAHGPTTETRSSSICLNGEPDTRPFYKKIWHYLFGRVKENTRAFYFATDTSFGLKLGWDGITGPYPDTLKLGYNRKELAFPPVFARKGCSKNPPHTGSDTDEEPWQVTVPSFFASLDNSSTVKDMFGSGVAHIQFFATGEAATAFVQRPDVNAAMNKKMFPHDTLTIDPETSVVVPYGTKTFKVTNGSGKEKFTLMYDSTEKATIDPSTGLYTAGENAGTSVVRAVDAANNTAVAIITVAPQ